MTPTTIYCQKGCTLSMTRPVVITAIISAPRITRDGRAAREARGSQDARYSGSSRRERIKDNHVPVHPGCPRAARLHDYRQCVDVAPRTAFCGGQTAVSAACGDSITQSATTAKMARAGGPPNEDSVMPSGLSVQFLPFKTTKKACIRRGNILSRHGWSFMRLSVLAR